MVKLNKPLIERVAMLEAHRAAFDKRMEAVRATAERLTVQHKLEMIDIVIDAINEGVPVARVAAALGYKQTNGIRTLFQLPISGPIMEALEDKRAAWRGIDRNEVEEAPVYPLFYRIEDSYDGTPQYKLEREDRELKDAIFVDAERVIWQAKAKAPDLTAAEYALLDAQFPEGEDYKVRHGWGKPTNTND